MIKAVAEFELSEDEIKEAIAEHLRVRAQLSSLITKVDPEDVTLMFSEVPSIVGTRDTPKYTFSAHAVAKVNHSKRTEFPPRRF